MALHDTGAAGCAIRGVPAPSHPGPLPEGRGEKGRKSGVSSSPSPHLSPWERSPQDVGGEGKGEGWGEGSIALVSPSSQNQARSFSANGADHQMPERASRSSSSLLRLLERGPLTEKSRVTVTLLPGASG